MTVARQTANACSVAGVCKRGIYLVCLAVQQDPSGNWSKPLLFPPSCWHSSQRTLCSFLKHCKIRTLSVMRSWPIDGTETFVKRFRIYRLTSLGIHCSLYWWLWTLASLQWNWEERGSAWRQTTPSSQRSQSVETPCWWSGMFYSSSHLSQQGQCLGQPEEKQCNRW